MCATKIRPTGASVAADASTFHREGRLSFCEAVVNAGPE